MADDTVQVDIIGNDQISNILEQINQNVAKMADSTSQATDKLTESTTNLSSGFEFSTTQLLSLANTASAFVGIQDTVINMQTRLENAQDRVFNAQDRVSQATDKLSEAQQKYGANSEEATKAQQDLERAQRQLEISTNNQERATAHLDEAYIGIIVQSIQFASGLYNLLKPMYAAIVAQDEMNTATAIGTALKNPLALAIGLAAAAYAVYEIHALSASTAQTEMNASSSSAVSDINGVTSAVNDANSALTEFSNQLSVYTNAPLAGESEDTKAIQDQKNKIISLQEEEKNLNKQVLSGETLDRSNKISDEIAMEKHKLDVMQQTYTDTYKLQHDALKSQSDDALAMEKLKESGLSELAGQTYQQRLDALQKYINDASAKIDVLIAKEHQSVTIGGGTSISPYLQSTNPNAANYAPTGWATTNAPDITSILNSLNNNPITSNPFPSLTSHHDFISRPGQDVATFSPNDTIIGVKDTSSLGGGLTVIIDGNVYGTDPEAMAKELYKRLRNKISI